MTSYTLRAAAADRVRTDVVVIGVSPGKNGRWEPCSGAEPVLEAYGRRFAPMLAALGFKGGFGETVQVPAEPLRASRLLVLGMGPAEEVTAERVRRAAGIAARTLTNAGTVTLALPAGDAAYVRAVVEGFRSGLYRFDRYRSTSAPEGPAEVVVLSETARRAESRDALQRAEKVGDLVDRARDWVNTPPNDLAPPAFAAELVTLAEDYGLAVEVMEPAALAKAGCGGILGVGRGSSQPPRLVTLSWTPQESRGSVALVGKGITYDSGGLSIKPGGSMQHMKSDMGGAAAVAAAVAAAAALELPVTVTGFLPLAENMLSGDAMRPGDVLRTASGRTVEVLNTDAEGRLILADALTFAARSEPEVILDVATLTGHAVVALGDRVAALLGDDEIVAEVSTAAGSSGEMFWPLPIPPEQRTSVRTESRVADLLQHNWVRWGGALYAAAFLEPFAEGLPWAHLDIAGPAFNTGGAWGHVPSGGTGFAVTTLVDFLSARAAG